MIYDITPCPAPRMTRADSWKERPPVLRYRAFKDECRLKRVQIPQSCKITFYLPMPDSWSAKKKASMIGQPHQQKPDLDNILKAALDAVFEDDSDIWSVHAEKRWAYKGSIHVHPMNILET